VSEDTLDLDTGDGLVSLYCKVPPEAKQALADYASAHKMPLRIALTHILECVSKDHSIIPKPTQYTAKLELSRDGGSVSIATCGVCSDTFSPSQYGDSIEGLLKWANEHKDKHGKKGSND
jgi:hypothetical protein